LRTSAGLTASGPILAELQGTILVLALFFVLLNLAVDLLQTALDPRIRRA
jgi:peptide/nickel transport system permease protein